MSEDLGLIRSSSLMGLGTILSRATGFIRNLSSASLVGRFGLLLRVKELSPFQL